MVVGAISLLFACSLSDQPIFELDDRKVRIEQVVSQGCERWLDEANLGSVELFELPSSRNEVSITREKLARMIRLKIPGLDFLKADKTNVSFRLFDGNKMSQKHSSMEGYSCFEAGKDISKGQIVSASFISKAQCKSESDVQMLKFNRLDKTLVAMSPISKGEYLGMMKLPDSDFVKKGDWVEVTVLKGHVAIYRKVRALQSSPEGEDLFVSSENGEVLKVTNKVLPFEVDS